MILAILIGAALGVVAWIPLWLMLDREPPAGAPVKVTFATNVTGYVQAMKDAQR